MTCWQLKHVIVQEHIAKLQLLIARSARARRGMWVMMGVPVSLSVRTRTRRRLAHIRMHKSLVLRKKMHIYINQSFMIAYLVYFKVICIYQWWFLLENWHTYNRRRKSVTWHLDWLDVKCDRNSGTVYRTGRSSALDCLCKPGYVATNI